MIEFSWERKKKGKREENRTERMKGKKRETEIKELCNAFLSLSFSLSLKYNSTPYLQAASQQL